MKPVSLSHFSRFRLGAVSAALCGSLFAGAYAHADTLRGIYELAVKNDPKLKAAEATYKANLEPEKQARSRLLPQINGDASYGRSERDQNSQSLTGTSLLNLAPGSVNTQTNTNNGSWSVNLSQTLFDLPAWFSFKSGEEISKQARAQFSAEQQDLIVRVADAYFTVLRQRDTLQVARAEELADKRQLDQAKQRFKVGLVAITDVQEARAAYDASYAQRLTAEGALATSYETLSTLTGQTQSNLWLLNKNFPVTSPQPRDRADWVKFALKNNYSLKAAQFAMDAAQENATSKRMEHMPKLTGSLSYQRDTVNGSLDTNPQSPLGFPPDSNTTTKVAMLHLTVPIYSGGYTSSVQRQAAEQYSASIERKIETERSVIQGARARNIAVNTDVERVKARAQSIVSALSALEATKAGYHVGTRNIVDVLQAQRVYFSAERNYANARYDYVLDMLRLKQVAGSLSPQDILNLNKWLVAPGSPKASNYKNTGDK